MVTDHPSPGSRLRREQRLGKGGDVLKWTHSANGRLTQGHQAALSFVQVSIPARHNRAISTAVAHFLHTEGVTGSNPVSPID